MGDLSREEDESGGLVPDQVVKGAVDFDCDFGFGWGAAINRDGCSRRCDCSRLIDCDVGGMYGSADEGFWVDSGVAARRDSRVCEPGSEV